MKNKQSTLKIGIGTATILMIFVVLCMVILSVLSLKEAQMNVHLVEKEKQYTQAYYEAQAQATMVFNAIQKKDSTPEQWQNISNTLDVDIQYNDRIIYYSVKINKNKQLVVELARDNTFTITKWVVENRRDSK